MDHKIIALDDILHRPPESNDIRLALEAAVQKTLDADYDLIALGGHEQAIAHRIAVYLEQRFPKYHIDCEYNRKKHLSKSYSVEAGKKRRRMRPDIVVHRRNTMTHNILAIEMKANANKGRSADGIKLKALQTPEEGYAYQEVAFVCVKNGAKELGSGVLEATIAWYDDEHKISNTVTVKNEDRKDYVKKMAVLIKNEKKDY